MFSIRIDEELQLALLEKRHAARIFELTDKGRNYLKQWLPWVDFTKTVADSEHFIQTARQQYIQNNGFQLAIVYKNEIVGVIGLHYIDWGNERTSIGYWLGEGYQGKGIMTRATAGLTTYCFEELQLNRVEIRVVPTNYKSRAIPLRLGYKLEGVLRQNEKLNGEFFDHEMYSMVKNEWGKPQ